MNSGAYLILNTKNNNKYVGSSGGLAGREKAHIRLLRKQTHYNAYLQRAWNKYGEDAFEFHTLALCAREKRSLLALEQFYFRLLRPEYNMLPTAGSSLGYTQTKEHRAKRSAAMMGKRHASGYRQTDEHKAKKAAAMKGYKHSVETRAKMSAQRKGKPWTSAQYVSRAAYIRGQ